MKLKLAMAASAVALMLASSASAAITIVSGELGGAPVNSDGTQSGNTVTGEGGTVIVHSDDGLSVTGSGAAIFDGPFDDLLVTLTGDFLKVGFNIDAADLASVMTLTVNGTEVFVENISTSNNANKYYLVSDDAFIKTLSFAFDPEVNNLKQLRLELGTPTGGIPEPATWGLMIMGFGGIGSVIRARRRQAVLSA